MAAGERYISPVGFAREPALERRRWIGRIVLAIFVVFIVWLLYNKVLNPSDTSPSVPSSSQGPLPGPI
jgi:hypothetical protein